MAINQTENLTDRQLFIRKQSLSDSLKRLRPRFRLRLNLRDSHRLHSACFLSDFASALVCPTLTIYHVLLLALASKRAMLLTVSLSCTNTRIYCGSARHSPLQCRSFVSVLDSFRGDADSLAFSPVAPSAVFPDISVRSWYFGCCKEHTETPQWTTSYLTIRQRMMLQSEPVAL